MADKSDHNSLPFDNPNNRPSMENLDVKQIADAIVELNITRKATLLYPPEHRQVKKSTQQACNRLEFIFSKVPEISLGIAAGSLIFEGQTLDSGNSIYKEFALSLSQHGIVVLTFKKGLTTKELANFFNILTNSVNQSQNSGGLANCLRKNDIQNIQIALIDYNKFSVTEKAEIARNHSDTSSSSHQDIWTDLAIQLMQNPSDTSSHMDIEPQKVARLLNDKPQELGAMLQKYENVVTNFLRDDQYNQLTTEDTESIKRINNLLQELNPHLRQQFLNSTLTQCIDASRKPKTHKFISQLSQNLIIEMLHQANLKEGPISESLMQLIQKISPTINGDDTSPSLEDTLELIGSKKTQYQELFKQEDYQVFVDQNYDHTLRQVSQGSGIKKDAEKIPENLGTLNQPDLDRHILQALIGLMEHCEEPDEYAEYVRKLIEIAKENIIKKDYSLAFEAIAILHRHSTAKQTEKIVHLAQKALAQLTDPKLLYDLIQTVGHSEGKLPPAIEPLLIAIGPSIVAPLVKRFFWGGSGEKQHSILNILNHFKKESVAAAHKLVEHSDIEQLKKLILLIRKINDRASSAYLRSLVAHTSPAISREALSALLYFKDPWGIFFLRDRLNSKQIEEETQAITMAGDYRLVEMVPHLTACLKFGALSKADIRRNSNLVSAMGKIGDSAAIPFLTKLVQRSWSLHRSNMKQLKIDIFKSLGNYPRSEIIPLLKIGISMKDKTIQQTCNQLRT